MEVSNIAFYDIVNGSLRSVRNIEGAAGVNSDGVRTVVDPITVYKEPEINEVETIEPEIKELETIESEAKESSEIVEETKNKE